MSFDNKGIQPQPQGILAGQDLGMRLPVFDIEVKPQKASAYTKMSQNELALQFYNLGFFNPQQVDQTIMCLDMMEFDGKDNLKQKVRQMGGMYEQMIMFQQLAISLAAKYEPAMARQLMASVTGQPMPQAINGDIEMPGDSTSEGTRVQNARAQAREASQPGGMA